MADDRGEGRADVAQARSAQAGSAQTSEAQAVEKPGALALAAGQRRVRIQIAGDPVSSQRLAQKLMSKGMPAKITFEWPRADGTLKSLAEQNPEQEPKTYARRLPVRKASGAMLYIEVDRIDWIEAVNQYVRLHTEEQGYLMRKSMTKLEQMLDPTSFQRIHRSSIVNLDRIQELQMESSSSRWAILIGGERLQVSARYWSRLQDALIGLSEP